MARNLGQPHNGQDQALESGVEITKTPHGGLWWNRAVLDEPAHGQWFDPQWWQARDAVTGNASGRGSVLFLRHDDDRWALRHYQRGGLVGRFNRDLYLYTGRSRVRSMAESSLLLQLQEWRLPSAVPVAASYHRVGPWYRADLITRRIDYERTLAELLAGHEVATLEPSLAACGQLIARFHQRGVDHADLNCHNLLLAEDRVYLIDLDRGAIRRPGFWQKANLARLLRSARKVVAADRRDELESAWPVLERAYRG